MNYPNFMIKHLQQNSDRALNKGMKIGYFYMTRKGCLLVEKLNKAYPGEVADKAQYRSAAAQWWSSMDALVFVMAAGIAVRTIAPLIQSKQTDPAVIVMDQDGRYVISLLSGHLGGANALAAQMAKVTGGDAVITTATDVVGVPAMDVFAKENGLTIENIHELKYISSAMVEKEPVMVISQWEIDGRWPDYVTVSEGEGTLIPGILAVVIGTPSFCARYKSEDVQSHVLYLSKKIYTIGTGCKKAVDVSYYRTAMEDFLQENQIFPGDIAAIATIDLKKEEPCILAQVTHLGTEFLVYTKEIVEAVNLDNASGKCIEASDFVRQVTGVGSVSEACAWLGSRKGSILAGKTKYKGVTFALAGEDVQLVLK